MFFLMKKSKAKLLENLKDNSKESESTQNVAMKALIESRKTTEGQSTAFLGLQPGWRKATFIVRDEYYQKMKDLAYWERISSKDLLDQVLGEFLSNKSVDPIPFEKPTITQGSEKG